MLDRNNEPGCFKQVTILFIVKCGNNNDQLKQRWLNFDLQNITRIVYSMCSLGVINKCPFVCSKKNRVHLFVKI